MGLLVPSVSAKHATQQTVQQASQASKAPQTSQMMGANAPAQSAQSAQFAQPMVQREIVTWPRLPKRSFREQLFVQGAAGFPGIKIDNVAKRVYVDQHEAQEGIHHISLAYLRNNHAVGALSADHAAALTELLRIPGNVFGGSAIQSQQVGILSLGLYLTDEQERPLLYNPMLFEALVHLTALRSAWLSAKCATLANDVLVCFEEPFLDSIYSPFFPLEWEHCVEYFEILFAGIQGCRGVIIGSEMSALTKESSSLSSWTPILDTSVELLGFDIYHHSDMLFQAAEHLPRFLERPGYLLCGIVPADEEALRLETTESLTERFVAIVDRLSTAVALSPMQFVHASFISTNDSLAHISTAAAEYALSLCRAVSHQVRSFYGLVSHQ